ncbi:MAG TPA: cell division protein FtsZ, partial [Acidobacteriota bacterium]|nr:cell division protein FtsZ [Acidobacteriota bacterium]
MNEELSSKLKFHLVEETVGAKIKVIGIGGGGGNAVNRMIETGIQGVEFIAVNTDLQALNSNRSTIKVPIGGQLTRGLGSGGRPETGKMAAQEDTERLIESLQGADMVFLTAGLGGGTGTGATPILANLAAEMDVLVIAIVTLPFEFEGKVRAKQAQEGLLELKNVVDTVIAIPNERLLQSVQLNTSIQDAFKMADDILRQAAQGISDLITKPGLINLDFADVKSIMKGMGMAFMGTGIASGDDRAVEAAQKAISSPLLIDTSIEGAHGVLINITGGKDVTLHEVSKASQLIHSLAHPEANIIFGTVID